MPEKIIQSQLVRSEITCSRIGFGGSRLHHIRSNSDRERLLETAYECGINYFDVAPVYGHGLAERTIGVFLKRHAGKRDRITLATKWGLPSAQWTDRVPKAGLRQASLAEILRQKVFGKTIKPLLTPELVVQSVEASLRRLETDYIDILWVHEPDPERMTDPEGVLNALDELSKAGKIRLVGVAGYPQHVGPTVRAFEQVRHLDFPILRQCDEQSWGADDVPDVTFGAISQEPQRFGAPPIEGLLAVDRLRSALARRTKGVVLVSTTKVENLRQLAHHFGPA